MTVIETMVAVALFAVAIVAVIGIYPASARAARQANGQLVAANLAEKELEFSRAQDYPALEDRDDSYQLTVESNGALTSTTYLTKVRVTELRPGVKRLMVSVTWSGGDRVDRKLEMETYVANLAP